MTDQANFIAARSRLSVVVPAVNGREILLECLDALAAVLPADLEIEILVVDRCRATTPALPSTGHRRIIVIDVPEATTIPRMREIAMRQSTASAVAVIEDHVLVPQNWARQMLNALAAGADVVGGSVRNAATETTTDWAAFLCEYSHLLAPLQEGPTDSVTGNNVVYQKSVLEKYWSTVSAGRWEDYLHAAMHRDGVRMTCRPEIAVGHKMHYRIHEYVSQRFLYSRAHAGMRAAAMSPSRRAVFAVGSLALPGLLFWRITRRVQAAGGYRNELLRSLPLLVLFVCAWAAGELVGFAAGTGDALARVK